METAALPVIILGLGMASATVFIFTIRNLMKSRNSLIDLLQFLAGLSLFSQELISFYDHVYRPTLPVCKPVRAFRFVTFVIFQILCNSVLISRITTLIPARYKKRSRIAFGVLCFFSIGFTFLATALNLKSNPCDDNVDMQLNSLGKILFALMYLLLLFCFLIPLQQHIKKSKALRINGSSTISDLETISIVVLVQITIPIVIYLIAGIIRYFNVKRDYNMLSYMAEDVSIFIAMSMTFNILSGRRETPNNNSSYSLTRFNLATTPTTGTPSSIKNNFRF